ncbi:MAG: Mu-like prophage major head subunit gpT family protein [Candidatus Lernaella stagnicola]|nr:Mu-like prophage major head subunit gpT family protein [Candidatus Lernaella stagnicola]
MLLNAVTYRATERTLRAAYMKALQELPTEHLAFFEDIPVTTDTITYKMIVRKSKVTEWIGDRTKQNLEAFILTRRLRLWDDSVAVDMGDILFDRLGQVAAAMADLADDYVEHQFDALCSLLADGHGSEAAYLGYDETSFFSAAHPIDTGIVSGGTQQNYWSDLDLSATNIVTVRAAMRAYKGENGHSMRVHPDTLWITPDLEGTAENIIDKNPLAGGEGNVLYKKFKIVVLDIDGATTLWGLADLSKRMKPFGFPHTKQTVPRWLVKPGEEHAEGLFGFDFYATDMPLWWHLLSKCVHTA